MALGKDDYEDDAPEWCSEKRGWDFEWVGLKPMALLTRCNRVLGRLDIISDVDGILDLRDIITIARNSKLYLPALNSDVHSIRKEVCVEYALPEKYEREYSVLKYVGGDILFDNDSMNDLLVRLDMNADILHKNRKADRVPQLVELLQAAKHRCERRNLRAAYGNEIIMRVDFLEILIKNHSGLSVV